MYRPYFKQRPQRRIDEDVYYNKVPVTYANAMRNWDRNTGPYELPIRKPIVHPGVNGVPPPVIQTIEYYNIPHYQLAVPYRNFVDQSHPSEQVYLRKNMAPNLSDQFRYAENSRHIRGPSIAEYSNEQWRPQNSTFNEGQHRSRTQTEPGYSAKQPWSRNINKSFSSNTINETENNENFLVPNKLLRSNSLTIKPNSPTAVELLVTNLDQNLDPQDLKNLLHSLFQEHASVVSLSLFHQTDGNLSANVCVSSQQDAQYVISQLHRRKIGHKRIVISHAHTSTTNPQVLRTQVIALLQEVPGYKMPLFKFRELLETRYRSSVPVSEIYKLRDICSVSEELGGRMISLCSNLRTTEPSAHLSPHAGLETPHCTLHCPNGLNERGWAEPETPSLPNVKMKLRMFTSKVHELLHSHMGTLPLLSFPVCYEIETSEKLPVDDSGVPLEHLITCVDGVELRLSSNMVKYLVWNNKTKKNDTTIENVKSTNNSASGSSMAMKCLSPPLANQLALFSRELVDLLKTAPHCQLPFSRFIPAYHHHFGRQCRVADYGYTKLVDLFDSMPHVVQVLGEGNKRVLTLSHGTQLRRFTSDLLRVLKSQASKQVALVDFSAAYERVLSRTFDPVDYGLCDLNDLLNEVSENTVVIKKLENNDTIIAIPKREQTSEEILKTKQFTVEVVDLLRHAHQYRILFNKFVPAYHHHFGHQCRVSDYGFTKLIDLFEVIPDIVKIEETQDGERTVSLTAKEALKVVRQQIASLVKSSRLQSIPLVALPATFLREYGYALRPEIYECESIEELITKFPDALHLMSGPAGPMVIIKEESMQQQLGIKIWSLLLQPPHSSTLSKLLQSYAVKYEYPCTFQQIEKYTTIFEITNNTNGEIEISLTPRYALAVRLYHLLFENNGTILLGNVDGMYLRKYGKVLRPAEYDATNLNILLSQLSFLVIVRGRRNKRNVSLNPNITAVGIPVPLNMKTNSMNDGNNNSNCNEQWPPPPAHTYLFNGGRTAISPPKPDTPPTYGNSYWYNRMWSPSRFASPVNLCIPMPYLNTPPVIGNPRTLYSPMKNLLPAYPKTEIQAPVSTLIPISEQLNRGKGTSPSRDSGIGCTSFCNSIEEPDSSINNIESEYTANRYEFFSYI